MKKYNKILIIFLFIVTICIGISINTKANLLDFEVLGGDSIEDLYSSTNGFGIDGYVVGSYRVNNSTEYYLDYYSSSTGYHVLITSNTFYTGVMTPEDDTYLIYTDDIYTLVSNINDYLLNNTDYNILLANNKTYVINNYVDSIGYIYYSSASNNQRLIGHLIPSDVEDYYSDYITNVGIENTFYIYGRFISLMRSYININHQQEINNILEDYNEDIEQARQDGFVDGYAEGLSTESLQQAFNDGKEEGYELGKSDALNEKETFLGTLFGIFDTFINGVKDMFDVDVFGINLSSIIVFIISISIIGFVLRRIF